MSSLLVGQVDIGQVGGGHVQGAELVSWQHSVGVEAGAVSMVSSKVPHRHWGSAGPGSGGER